MYAAPFSSPSFSAADVQAATKAASTPQTPPSVPILCEDGRHYLTDPLTGRKFCACHLSHDSPHPHLPGGVASLPGGLKALSGSPGAAVPPGMESAASYYYGSLLRGLPVRPDPNLAAHPYSLLYAGYDINGLGVRRTATRETTGPLKAWLHEHRKNPYPTKAEKIMLAIVTRMSLTQVSTWFANARRRLKKESRLYTNSSNNDDDHPDKDDDDDNDTGSGTMRDNCESDEDINVDINSDLSDNEDNAQPTSATTSATAAANNPATSSIPPSSKTSPASSSASLSPFPSTSPFSRPAFARGLPGHIGAAFGVLPIAGATNGVLHAMSPAVSFGVNPGVNFGVNPGVNFGGSPGVSLGVSPGVGLGVNPGVNFGVNLGVSPVVNLGASPRLSPSVSAGLSPGGPLVVQSNTSQSRLIPPTSSSTSSGASPVAPTSRPKIWSISEIIHSGRSHSGSSSLPATSTDTPASTTLSGKDSELNVNELGSRERCEHAHDVREHVHEARAHAHLARAHAVHDLSHRGLLLSSATAEAEARHNSRHSSSACLHPLRHPVRHPVWLTSASGFRATNHTVNQRPINPPQIVNRVAVKESLSAECSPVAEMTPSCNVEEPGESSPQTEALDLQTKKEEKENKSQT